MSSTLFAAFGRSASPSPSYANSYTSVIPSKASRQLSATPADTGLVAAAIERDPPSLGRRTLEFIAHAVERLGGSQTFPELS